MKIFITYEQKAGIEKLHRESRDKQECDRIKAIIQTTAECYISVAKMGVTIN